MRKFHKLGLGAALAGVSGFAAAAVPEAVTTAISTLQTDGVTIATTMLVATIAVLAVHFLRKGMRG